jgi:ribose transport system substrate-binding protein
MQITRRQFTSGTLTAIAAAGLQGCSPTSTSGKPTIAVLFDGLYSPFWIASHDAIIADLKSRDFEVTEAMSAQDDSKQLSQVKSMIARGVAGIILVHTDSNAVIPAIRAANAANVPLVHFNRAPAESDAFSVAIQADNRKITQTTVQCMVDVARERGGTYKAAILMGHLGDGNAIARRDGFFDIVDQHTDLITIVSRIPTQWNADQAFAGLTNAFNANPDINFLFTSSDFMFPQIVQVMKAREKYRTVDDPEHVVLGGFDGDRAAYEMLRDRYLDADGVQDLQYEATLCVNAIVDMIAGKLTQIAGEPNPRIIFDPGFAITQSNLDEVKQRMWGYQLSQQEEGAAASP